MIVSVFRPRSFVGRTFCVLLGALVVGAFLPLEADAQRSRPGGSRSLRAPSVQRTAPSGRSIRRAAPRAPQRSFSSPRRSGSSRSFNGLRSGRGLDGLAGIAERLGSNRNSSRTSRTPILDSLFGRDDDHRSNRRGVLGDLLRDRYDRDRYDDDDEFADAYMAVGLANAAVGLIGVLSENNRGYRDDCRYCAAESACPPAPVVERVVVEEGRYEKYEVWIPERYDPRTGRKLGGGFYEQRTRYVPATYAYREVGGYRH